ncbi:helix-turn-helix domain-containing protein [Chryseobacterium carnipullorum]|uniref:DNA gyrase inhibitor n=3 Tax=Chryseobacterium carnipullorum TaxID=1124835 RepID=A0A1M6ZE32_CHRCU|nr:helix-turn-helix domain-containing protein [Chryseobacterium carnipullorum]AZA47711.1 helix-turn-helix domain-containing protein [Chryseobacterium carnipullorum]SHL28634.1 Helix-turn-helix domain-containing protein [Chryseobacterium carnipullorum]STD11439.1 DNA gyrase inhibitor [Chryseobacterium carnipullorum]
MKKYVNLQDTTITMKRIFTFLLLSANFFYAQKQLTDSLKGFSYAELKKKFNDYDEKDKIQESKIIAKYYLQKAKSEKNNLQMAEGYLLVHFNEDFPLAMKYIDSVFIVTKNTRESSYDAIAYRMKGNLYYKNDNLKAALDNYIVSLKYAQRQKDQKLIAYANLNIAYINSHIGRNVEAAKMFRHYYDSNELSESEHNQTRVNLINCYIESDQLDSVGVLIKEGLDYSTKNQNKYSVNQYLYLSGFSYLKQKKYEQAIGEFSKAYDYFSDIEDNNANYVLYSLGKSYEGLNDKKKTVEYFTKLDANVEKTNITFPDLRDVYTFLIDYYKDNDDTQKQLYYIDRFLKVDKKLDEQFKYLSTELPKKYDTPNLLREKENIINDLNNNKISLYASISVLLLILILFIYLYYKSKKTEKQYRKIAQDLIHSIEKKHMEPVEIQKNEFSQEETQPLIIEEVMPEIKDKTGNALSEDVTQSILKDLNTFESKGLFLKKGITLASLAKTFKTNTAYLSEVINTHQGKNFTTYLNDLRIDYVSERLLEDKKLRSYKLPAIADELGYNNVQAFSAAFKKKTGTTPAIYIKEIENSIIS